MHAATYTQCLLNLVNHIVMAAPNLSSADVNRIIQAISCAIGARPDGSELSTTESSLSGTLTAHHSTSSSSSSSSSSQATERFERIDGNGGGQLRRSYSRGGFSGGSQGSSQDSGELSANLSSRRNPQPGVQG